ncbi:MAG: flavodoxin [Arcobacter sp.]|nr:MAG: flavodoxin [Arcobacter sp.]
MATAIFYASSTGNTEYVAKLIAKELSDIKLIDIATEGVSSMKEYDKLILGIPTWGDGELSDEWEDNWEEFKKIDFTGKTVALFGLGDQEGYDENYLDAMGIVYEHLIEQDVTFVGQWEITDEYSYEASRAVVDDMFVGLALDEDNQDDLTQERVTKWCGMISESIL